MTCEKRGSYTTKHHKMRDIALKVLGGGLPYETWRSLLIDAYDWEMWGAALTLIDDGCVVQSRGGEMVVPADAVDTVPGMEAPDIDVEALADQRLDERGYIIPRIRDEHLYVALSEQLADAHLYVKVMRQRGLPVPAWYELLPVPSPPVEALSEDPA